MKYCLVPICIILFSGIYARADISSKVPEKSHRGLLSADSVFAEKCLMGCVRNSATPHERGLVYAKIATMYGKDLSENATNAIHYAEMALECGLDDVVEGGKMHQIIIAADDLLWRNEKGSETRIRERSVRLLTALSYLMDYLHCDERQSLRPVFKYDVETSDEQYQKILQLHEDQVKMRISILQQNRLIDLSDDFCRRLVMIYNGNVQGNAGFETLLEEVVKESEKRVRILKFLNSAAKVKTDR